MDADLALDPVEARVLGSLVEKGLTTPDQYPLTVNAATAACNQKSNRDPVMDLAESQVQHALETLMVRGYAGLVHAAGGRTDRYRHNLEAHLSIDRRQLALLCVLLLRGAQTAGELRTRCARMADFESPESVEQALAPIIERELVRKLAPSPGSRAARFVQLLAADEDAESESSESAGATTSTAATAAAAAPNPIPTLAQRIESLESDVTDLRAELARLKDQLGG